MSEIVGTIISVENFLSKNAVHLSVQPSGLQPHTIDLSEDRKYSIPAFQRELRWDENNLKTLLVDLSRGDKYLGNVLLSVRPDHTCDIIDGQQRTTILMLIIACIRRKFEHQIDIIDLCPLYNESFSGFSDLLNRNFDKSAFTETE